MTTQEKNVQPNEFRRPEDIEKESFRIIRQGLTARKLKLPEEELPVTMRVIHTTADFEYAKTLYYSDGAVKKLRELLEKGTRVVTDTNMAKAGINAKKIEELGGEMLCFMSDPDVEQEAKERDITVNNFDLPDFYVIGFQEIVELNTQNIIYNSNNKKKDQIKSLISESLNSIINNNNDNNDSYVLVKDIDLVGIYLLVFIKSNHMNKITKIDFQIVKNGLMGNIGNKGSCFVRMNVNDTIICIANNHFSAGIQYSETRRSEIVNVLNTTINKYPNVPFKDYDYFFLFGDLNIRLNLELQDENIVNLINKFNNNYFNNNNNFENIINNILKFDQFKIYQNETSIISNVEEGKINFCPTYKYFIGENKYDVRKRVPAWCDRILFKKNSHTKCLCYNRCEFTLSDHKPVYGLYQITTRKIDKEKRNKILEEIREKFNKNFNNNKNFTNVQKNISENIDENFFKINNNN